MSGQHRRTRRTKQSTRIEPYRWLGAGALTFGLGVALASGAGIASAEETGAGGSTSGTEHSSAASDSSPRGAEHGSAGADDAPTGGTDKESTSSGPQKSDAHTDTDEAASSTDTDDSPGSERNSEKTHAQQTTESDDDPESSASTENNNSPNDDQGSESGDDAENTALVMTTQPERPHTAARAVVEQFSPPTTENAEPSSAAVPSDSVDITPTAGAAPAANPATDLLAAILRQIQETFFNLTPTATPRQIATSTNGTITGTVGPDDADGDPLQTTLSQGPVHGSVTVNADGTFSYTPSYALASSGGTDSFSVTISELNAGDHVHGFQGIVANIVRTLSGGTINLDDGSTVTKTVTVVVTAGMPTYVVDGVFSPGGTPIGITTGRDGRLWVSRGTSAVAVLDKHGNLIETVDIGEAVSQLAVSVDGRI